MTLERAYYHKLMLEVGLTESFDQELDNLLEKEDPLSELTLALSTCGGDRNEQIHILNEFICSVPKEQIDSDAVFSLVILTDTAVLHTKRITGFFQNLTLRKLMRVIFLTMICFAEVFLVRHFQRPVSVLGSTIRQRERFSLT